MADDYSIDDLNAVGAKPIGIANVAATQGINPQHAADALKNGPPLGVPPTLAMHDPKQVNDTARTQSNQAILQSSPHLNAAVASDPVKAAAVSDDIGPMGVLEKIAHGLRGVSFIKDLTDPALSAVRTWNEGRQAIDQYPEGSPEHAAGLQKVEAGASFFDLENLFGIPSSIANVVSRPAASALSYIPAMREAGESRQSAAAGINTGLNAVGSMLVGLPGLGRRNSSRMAGTGGAESPVGGPRPSAGGAPAEAVGGAFPTDEHGFVTDPTGKPATFATAKDARLWQQSQTRAGVDFAGEPDIHPGTREVGFKIFKQPEFTEPPAPGVEPAVDANWRVNSEAAAEHLNQLEEAWKETKTSTRAPSIAADLVDQASGGETIKIPFAKINDALSDLDIMSQEHFGKITEDPVVDVALSHAINSGQDLELPVGKWLEHFANTPLGEFLKPSVSVGAVPSQEDMKAIPETEHDALAKAWMAYGMAGLPESTQAKEIQFLKTISEENQLPETKALLAAWDAVHNPEAKPKEPEVDEDTLAAMADQGMSPHDFYTGKEFPEPEDLETGPLDEHEQTQWQAAKQSVQQAIPRVVKEKFLTKLFKDAKSAGMTEPQFKAWSERLDNAFKGLTDKLWKQTYAKVKTQYTKEWNEAYNRILPQVMDEYMSQPVVIAEHALRFSKTDIDKLTKETVFKDAKGEPMVFYRGHKGAGASNVGEPNNPKFRVNNYNVISFATNPKFAKEWIGLDQHYPISVDDSYSWDQTKAKTVYIVNILSKHPADFRKSEDVKRAAEWHAENQLKNYDEHDLKVAMLDTGLDPKTATKADLIAARAKQFEDSLRSGAWTLWEQPEMWKDLGWDAAHMLEHSGQDRNFPNVCVADGNQVFFRYRPRQTEQGWKISTDIKKLYPKYMWSELPNSMFRAEGGLSADELAAKWGFDSGEALLKELTHFEVQRGETPFRKHVKDTIVKTARQRTIQEVGDILSPDKILEDARAIFSAPEVTDLFIKDWEALGKVANLPVDKAALEAHIDESFQKLPISRAIRVKQFEGYVTKWGNRLEHMALKTRPDYIKAFAAKQAQITNMVMLRKAHDTRDLFQKKVKQWSKLAKKKTDGGKDQVTLDAIHGILNNFGFNVPKANLGYADWKAEQEPWNVSTVTLPQTKLKDMTVSDFNDLVQVMDNMVHLWKSNKEVLVGDRKANLDAAVDELIAERGNVPPKKPETDLIPGRDPLKKFGRFSAEFDAGLRMPRYIINGIDARNPSGITHRIMVWAAENQMGVEHEMLKDWLKHWADERKLISKSQVDRWDKLIAAGHGLMTPEGTHELTNMKVYDVLGMVLNSGTALNKWHLHDGGWNWSPEAVQRMIDTHMEPEDMELAQRFLDYLEKLWPKIADAEYSAKGVVPPRQKPIPILHRGVEYKGGYFPLRVDMVRAKHLFNKAPTDESLFNDIMGLASTPDGHLQSRTQAPYPVSLDWQATMYDHIPKVIKRIAYGDYVSSTRKFLNDKRVRKIVTDAEGEFALRELHNMVRRIVGFRMVDPLELSIASDFARTVRNSAYFAQAAWNATIFVEHSSAFIQSKTLLGEKWLGKGILQRMQDWSASKWIEEEAPYMAIRKAASTRELREIYDRIHQQVGLLPEKPSLKQLKRLGQEFGHWFLTLANHHIIAESTYMGAKQKALTELKMGPQEAVHYALDAVARSHASGLPIDMSTFQGNTNEWVKLATMYMSYHNVQYNLVRDEGMTPLLKGPTIGPEGQKRGPGRGTGAQNVIMLLVVAGILARLLTNHQPKSDKTKDVALWMTEQFMGSLLGTIPLAGPVAQYYLNRAVGKNFDFNFSPAEEEFKNLGQAGAQTYHWAHLSEKQHRLAPPGKGMIQHDLEALGFLMPGLGGGGIGRAAQAAYDISKGGVKHPVAAVAFGPSHEKKAPE